MECVKLLHLSDLHIGKRVNECSMLEDQRYILEQIAQLAIERKVDGVLLADGGLAGIVIQVGPNYAKVRSIIDDNSNVSARNLSTSDLCVVSGSLKTMNESSLIDFDDLRDKEDQAKVGDQIVTSNISDMFLEGIPIGYITDIKTDSNNLTKSGHIATIVDFEHLDDVFVILQTKDISTDTTNEQGGE